MRLTLFFVLAVTLVAAAAQPADRADPVLFVQSAIVWQPTPHGYDVGNGSIVFADAAHNLLKVVTQLYRDPKDSALTVDLKSGYAIYAGKWKSTGNDAIGMTFHLVDTFKYIPTQDSNGESVESGALSGVPFGPLRAVLTIHGVVFEPPKRFRSRVEMLQLWSQYIRR